MYLEDLKHEWTGFKVCEKCWEPRHPQEFLRAREDKQAVNGGRHIPTYEEWTFVTPTFPPDTSDL